MKTSFQHAGPLTRTEILVRYAEEARRATGRSWQVFGQEVAERYLERVPVARRRILFHETGDAVHDVTANTQIVRRYMDDEINARFPVDLEEAFLDALPEPWRSDCIAALAGRLGCISAPISDLQRGDVIGDVQAVASLFTAAGHAGEVLARIIADGRIDMADVPHAREAAVKLRHLQGFAQALIARIEAIEREAAQ